MARDFGGVFDYFWRNVNLVVANPIELCDISQARNVDQLNGFSKLINYFFQIKFEGAIALIKRGSCSFMEKAYAAEQGGAIGAIIYNSDQNDIDSAIDMIDDESGLVINIPVLWIVGKNGHMMVESMLDVRTLIKF